MLRKKMKKRVSQAAMETFNSVTSDLDYVKARLRYAAVVTSIVHIGVTTLLFVMGYLRGHQKAPDANGTVVGTAFGALATVVYALTSTYEILLATQKRLTTRTFHQQGFRTAVTRALVLIFFLWAGLVIFMLHSGGFNIWTAVDDTLCKGKSTCTLRQMLGVHVTISVLVFVIDFLMFVLTTKKLAQFKKQETEESATDSEDVGVPLPMGEEESRPFVTRDYIQLAVTVVLYLLYIIDLIFVVDRTINSASVITMIIAILFLVFAVLAFVKVYRDIKGYTRNHVNNYRTFALLHMTSVVATFWVTFAVVFFQESGGQGFFGTVLNFPADRVVLVVLQIVMFVISLVAYGYMLYMHQRGLAILDEIASLNIFDRQGEKI